MYHKLEELKNLESFFKWLQDKKSYGKALLTVTPESAKFLLDHTAEYAEKNNLVINRNKKINKIDVYALSMQKNLWNEKVCGSIGFTNEGIMLDGQNRCAAQIKANFTTTYIVIKNLILEDQMDMDRLTPRSTADDLAIIKRRTYGKNRSAIVKQILYTLMKKNLSLPSQVVIAVDEILNPHMVKIFEACSNKVRRGLRTAPIQAALTLYHINFPSEVEEFMKGYFYGTDLKDGSPELILREQITDRIDEDHDSKERMEDLYMTCNALMYYLSKSKRGKKYRITTDIEGYSFIMSCIPKIINKIRDIVKF